jgi:hypothetical protein
MTLAHDPASCGGLPAQQAIVQRVDGDDDDDDALEGASPESSASISIAATTKRVARNFKAMGKGNRTEILLSEQEKLMTRRLCHRMGGSARVFHSYERSRRARLALLCVISVISAPLW